MKTILAILFVSLVLIPGVTNGEKCSTSMSPLVDLLNQYSTTNGTKFVVDPRVKAKVTMVGINSSDLNAATLIGILNIHGFTALTSNEVVYVMPDVVAEASGDKFGVRWDG